MRARIALRKAGIEPSPKNVDKELASIQKQEGHMICVADIITAFEAGDEVRHLEMPL